MYIVCIGILFALKVHFYILYTHAMGVALNCTNFSTLHSVSVAFFFFIFQTQYTTTAQILEKMKLFSFCTICYEKNACTAMMMHFLWHNLICLLAMVLRARKYSAALDRASDICIVNLN